MALMQHLMVVFEDADMLYPWDIENVQKMALMQHLMVVFEDADTLYPWDIENVQSRKYCYSRKQRRGF
ncbi:predicted protein [Arabidopsis lyrata subsp. lyrata]|uniref:Predicted protein n=1 Tax=Arabidopsis lyrata subsp. lyrata TaxID=81972 RepID=D7KBX9_ARALL|nr:predicted protein [Arabidopsis lyrata subsp. lyrata]